MMSNSRSETIPAADGGTFEGYLSLPESGSGPGLVLLQEIFGVNEYIKQRADTLAELGYTVLAPDLYWRIEPGIALPQDQEGLEKAFGYMQRLDRPKAALDAAASLTQLRRLPETGRRAGVVGFCLGGRLGYQVAKSAEISLAKALARELAPDNVRVLSVAPGSVLFPGGSWWRRREADPEAMARFVETDMPLGRFGRLEEVADVVSFLCSDRASLVTGACIPVDGCQGKTLL
jgi:hypothetical protein